MKIYNYHPVTGEYISTSDAEKSPLEKNVYLVPAYATDIAAPSVTENQVACFKDGAWALSDDFRGVEYWLEDGSKKTISEIGEVVPENGSLTEVEPPEPLATDQLINRVQFKSMLALLDKSIDDVMNAIDAVITDPTQNTIAKVKVTDSDRYARDNELFTILAPSLNLTDAAIDAAWEQAVQI